MEKYTVCVCWSPVSGSALLWTLAQQASLSMGFSRQEHWIVFTSDFLPCYILVEKTQVWNERQSVRLHCSLKKLICQFNLAFFFFSSVTLWEAAHSYFSCNPFRVPRTRINYTVLWVHCNDSILVTFHYILMICVGRVHHPNVLRAL